MLPFLPLTYQAALTHNTASANHHITAIITIMPMDRRPPPTSILINHASEKGKVASPLRIRRSVEADGLKFYELET